MRDTQREPASTGETEQPSTFTGDTEAGVGGVKEVPQNEHDEQQSKAGISGI